MPEPKVLPRESVAPPQYRGAPMKVHLIDGTYELFRQYFGQPPRAASDGGEIGAVRGVVLSIMRMLDEGVTHLGVATDHVITSFRNDLWPGYKNGNEVAPELLAQFEPLEVALAALGIVVWPMVELEADDALASAARTAEASPEVEQVIICTPDKDLSQCVVGDRVVQLDRRTGVVRDEAGVWERFGVGPSAIPEWLALVGDSADGFPGLEGWGPRTAAAVLAHYGTFDLVPDDPSRWAPEVRAKVRGADRLAATLSRDRERARLFRTLATLRRDAALFDGVDELRWTGPTEDLARVGEHLRDRSLVGRAARLAQA
jgi:5'-3' exonuclease